MSTGKKYTVFITFGRGDKDERLTDQEWLRLKQAIIYLIHDVDGDIIQRPFLSQPRDGDQIGVWRGIEQAGTVVAFVYEPYLSTVRVSLRSICRQFRQEAIGFVAVPGADHLVTTEDE